MSHHARRILMPGASSHKRKEIDRNGPLSVSKPSISQTSVTVNVTKEAAATEPEPQPFSSNRLLAGYMAYEFLTKGTLLGEKFDPARAAAVPLKSGEHRRRGPLPPESIGKSKPPSYAEVASLIQTENAQVPGVVNPTQLARWLQM